MKKHVLILALATGIVANGISQQVITASGGSTGTINTSPFPNLSQFEVSGKLLTQNSFSFLPSTDVRITGSFASTARWNSMGNLQASPTSQILNGFRTQTDGKGLAFGHSIPNGGIVSDPFIEWIGSTPGNLNFNYAFNPTGAAAARVPAFTIQPNAIAIGGGANAYANKGLIGALQTGSFGNVTPGNNWVALGQAPAASGAVSLIGNRIQNDGFAFLTSIRPNAAGVKKAYIDFGGNAALADISQFDLVFRSFAADNDFNSTRNSMSIKRNGNILLASETSFTSPGVLTFYNPKVEINTRNIANSEPGSTQQLGLAVNTENYEGILVKSFNAAGIRSETTGNSAFTNNANAFEGIASGGIQRSTGVYGTALDPSTSILDFRENAGIIGFAQGANTNFGVYGAADWGGSFFSSNYGVYGRIINPSTFTLAPNYAGYFDGETFCTNGIWSASDKKLKTNIFAEENAISKIMKLKPVSYNFDLEKNKWINLSGKNQHGFISQDLEEVFPEMVQDITHPIFNKDNTAIGKETVKAINYSALISVLTKAVQEQQVQIESLTKQLTAKTSETFVLQNNATEIEKQIVKANAFSLSQNAPNPFSEKTTITYTVPTNVKKAMLGVFDLNGKMLLQYNLQTGKNQLIVNGNTLTAGMYLYTLIADGEEVLSKRMILTR